MFRQIYIPSAFDENVGPFGIGRRIGGEVGTYFYDRFWTKFDIILTGIKFGKLWYSIRFIWDNSRREYTISQKKDDSFLFKLWNSYISFIVMLDVKMANIGPLHLVLSDISNFYIFSIYNSYKMWKKWRRSFRTWPIKKISGVS